MLNLRRVTTSYELSCCFGEADEHNGRHTRVSSSGIGFTTALPMWGRSSQIMSGLTSKRDSSPKRGQAGPALPLTHVHRSLYQEGHPCVTFTTWISGSPPTNDKTKLPTVRTYLRLNEYKKLPHLWYVRRSRAPDGQAKAGVRLCLAPNPSISYTRMQYRTHTVRKRALGGIQKKKTRNTGSVVLEFFRVYERTPCQSAQYDTEPWACFLLGVLCNSVGKPNASNMTLRKQTGSHNMFLPGRAPCTLKAITK